MEDYEDDDGSEGMILMGMNCAKCGKYTLGTEQEMAEQHTGSKEWLCQDCERKTK